MRTLPPSDDVEARSEIAFAENDITLLELQHGRFEIERLEAIVIDAVEKSIRIELLPHGSIRFVFVNDRRGRCLTL
jgi:hypothetical protein